jgi:hypothetical protein
MPQQHVQLRLMLVLKQLLVFKSNENTHNWAQMACQELERCMLLLLLLR